MSRIDAQQVLAQNLGTEDFPVDWAEGESALFWISNDLHVPNPVSPMYFSIGGYWLTADYMFRRFGLTSGCDWLGKVINGFLYTAIVPADPSVRVVTSQFDARYVPRTPLDRATVESLEPYLEWLLPTYGAGFTQAWNERLKPEIERTFAYFDALDLDSVTLPTLAVLLEDAIDMHDRHWKFHWQLNFGQLAATLALENTAREVKGDVDAELLGRLQSSADDRNWDSIRELTRITDVVRTSPQLSAAFAAETAAAVLRDLQSHEEGRRFLRERIDPYAAEYGNKAIWTHEFLYTTWREDPRPIINAIRGYLEVDYDCDEAQEAIRKDLREASEELLADAPPGEARARLEQALALSLPMNPLTPDHHFYIDQGTNARVRYALMAIGRRLVEEGVLQQADDVMFLEYEELRTAMANPTALDTPAIVASRRDAHEQASELTPPDWLGTATEEAVNQPYLRLWGFPERLNAERASDSARITGLAASPGVVVGTVRSVASPAEFDEVGDGDILVCRMTNPAWMVVFTRIAGLVTDAGGAISHPAVIAREFGIPAVVGTSNATTLLATGDRVRVDGTTGVVQKLS